MWKWDQSAGKLYQGNTFVANGYSGRDWAKNNPAAEGKVGMGPIPRGKWKIGAPYNSKNTGPYTLTLTAIDGNNDDTHQPTGRGAFRIHGDSVRAPGTASHGCIILPPAVRELIWNSSDHELEVVE